MIPETVGALLTFLLLAVPGMTFELLRQRRRSTWSQTGLEEAVRITLFSIVFDAAAAAALALVALAWPSPFVSPRSIADHGFAAYWHIHYGAALLTILFLIVVAELFVALAHRSLNVDGDRGLARRLHIRSEAWLGHGPHHVVEKTGVWRTLFRDRRPTGADTLLAILKRDGSLWMGRLAAYTVGDEPDRDIALQQPITVWRDGREDALDPRWLVAIIASSEIVDILVTYPPSQRETAPVPGPPSAGLHP